MLETLAAVDAGSDPGARPPYDGTSYRTIEGRKNKAGAPPMPTLDQIAAELAARTLGPHATPDEAATRWHAVRLALVEAVPDLGATGADAFVGQTGEPPGTGAPVDPRPARSSTGSADVPEGGQLVSSYPVTSGTKEEVALRLMQMIAAAEGYTLDNPKTSPATLKPPSREWVLRTYGECLRAVMGQGPGPVVG